MSDPTTSNILLAVPTRGSDAGTWDVPVNNNSTAIDGYVGGVQTISLSSGSTTLTAPAGVVTATSGPTQAQNAVLKLTGTLTGNVQINLPLPGYYIIDNQCVGNLGNIIRISALGNGNAICIDYGETQHIYNDGTNVKFCNLGRIGAVEIWGGLSSIPAWVSNCTIPPYLYCDGTVYNFSTYPILGRKLQAQFGGNGSTTFAVPDLRGRVALPFDGTGGRITVSGCGIVGTTIGSAADNQFVVLSAAQIPGISSSGLNGITVTSTVSNIQQGATTPVAGGANFGVGTSFTTVTSTGNNNISVSSNNTGGQLHTNVQPSIMTGIAVIRAA